MWGARPKIWKIEHRKSEEEREREREQNENLSPLNANKFRFTVDDLSPEMELWMLCLRQKKREDEKIHQNDNVCIVCM